jgi:hypothetical protein
VLAAAGLSLNTVKRCARAAEPQPMIRAPKYRATLVDPTAITCGPLELPHQPPERAVVLRIQPCPQALAS